MSQAPAFVVCWSGDLFSSADVKYFFPRTTRITCTIRDRGLYHRSKHLKFVKIRSDAPIKTLHIRLLLVINGQEHVIWEPVTVNADKPKETTLSGVKIPDELAGLSGGTCYLSLRVDGLDKWTSDKFTFGGKITDKPSVMDNPDRDAAFILYKIQKTH